MKRPYTLALLALMAACGKAPQENSPGPSTPPKTDTMRTPMTISSETEEVKKKYVKPFRFHCQVRIDQELKDQFEWENPSETHLYKILNYKLRDKEMAFIFRLNEQIVFKDVVSFTDEHRKEYFMENTPVLGISYRRDLKKILNNGEIHQREKFNHLKFYENIPTTVFVSFEESVTCTLKTEITQGFEHQWMIVR